MGEVRLKKIICYRKGCNNPAKWTVPGNVQIHVCDNCLKYLIMQGLQLEGRVTPIVGPSEFKEEDNVAEDEVGK